MFEGGGYYSNKGEYYGIVELMRYKFNKRIATFSQRDLAYTMFDNSTITESAKLLLNKTPNTVKGIEKDLRKTVDDSSNLVDETLKVLK